MKGFARSHELLTRAARFNASEIREGLREVEGLNAKLALLITRSVGTMACAYLFAAIEKQFADTETIMDRLDTHTAGGLAIPRRPAVGHSVSPR